MTAPGSGYLAGCGVARNYDEALRLFRAASDGGEPFGMVGLPRLYENGWGVPKDDQQACKWFRMAQKKVTARRSAISD